MHSVWPVAARDIVLLCKNYYEVIAFGHSDSISCAWCAISLKSTRPLLAGYDSVPARLLMLPPLGGLARDPRIRPPFRICDCNSGHKSMDKRFRKFEVSADYFGHDMLCAS